MTTSGIPLPYPLEFQGRQPRGIKIKCTIFTNVLSEVMDYLRIITNDKWLLEGNVQITLKLKDMSLGHGMSILSFSLE